LIREEEGVQNTTEMRRRLAFAILILLLTSATGCSVVQHFVGSDRAARRAQELQDLQTRVMRFADEYVGRMIAPVDALQAADTSATARLAAQSWKVSQATSAYTIASGPNAYGNALDFIVLATLSRMVVEDQWVGEQFGESARALYDVHRHLEALSWELVTGVADEPQKQQLHTLIDSWRARNPKVEAVSYIHFVDFARSIELPGQRLDTSLLALVGLDPLSNLDPAVHEITQSRQLAERAIYYLQRSPSLLDMQVERLTYQLAAMPETRQMLGNVERTSLAAEQAGSLAREMPAVLARERQAAIEQLLKALSDQQQQTLTLAGELRQTLEAGTTASKSMDTTIRSLDSLVARIKGTQPRRDPRSPRRFDVEEYTEAAREFGSSAREIERLIRTMNSGAPGVTTVTHSAFADAKDLVNYAFRRIAALLVLLVALIFTAVAAYRVFFARL
jgi:hypothetical protein